MPTYEYVCRSCEHEFEEFQSMKAAPLRRCPQCGRSTLERKIGLGGGIIFKGGGFYETDYRSEGYRKAAEADAKAASGKADEPAPGHAHTGACGCGRKPADQCPSAAPRAEKTPKPATISTGAAKKPAPGKPVNHKPSRTSG
jgi:putative FmdB family regulatory protein